MKRERARHALTRRGNETRPSLGRSCLFAAQAGEGRLVLGVDGSGVIATSTSATEVRRGRSAATLGTLTTLGTLGTLRTVTAGAATATLTTTSTAGTATAATAATGALRLDESGVEVNGLLDLALTLTLALASGTGNVDVLGLILLEGLGAGPLLVELAALVGLTGLEGGIESELLLGLLGQVVGVRDALVLGLSSLLASGILSEGLLLLALGNGLTGLLILQLGLTLGSTPGLSSLLVGATDYGRLARFIAGYEGMVLNVPDSVAGLVGVTIITLPRVATTTAWHMLVSRRQVSRGLWKGRLNIPPRTRAP